MGRPPLFHHLVGIVSKKLLHCAKQRLLLARPVGWLRSRRLGRGKATNVMTCHDYPKKTKLGMYGCA